MPQKAEASHMIAKEPRFGPPPEHGRIGPCALYHMSVSHIRAAELLRHLCGEQTSPLNDSKTLLRMLHRGVLGREHVLEWRNSKPIINTNGEAMLLEARRILADLGYICRLERGEFHRCTKARMWIITQDGKAAIRAWDDVTYRRRYLGDERQLRDATNRRGDAAVDPTASTG